MNIVIFGATGGTGQEIVKQALEQGHTVTAFVRNPAKLEHKHTNLKIIQGDVLDYTSVEKALQGQDVVLCALGLPASNKSKGRAKGTKNIIQAMEKIGVKRFICQSSLGFGDSKDFLPFHFKYLIVPFFLRHTFADHELQENHIKQSQLDWIIVRPVNLTNGERIGIYKHGFDANENIKLKISRADVADFMLKQLTSNTYLHKTLGLSY